MSELDFERRTAQLAGVDFPHRIIELVVMPYESPTVIKESGREFTEVVSRGAFENISASRRRISVNRDHRVTDVIGKAVKLNPDHPDGLRAEVWMSESDVGERALRQASEGLLDASAGFQLKKNTADAQVWETRDRRRLNHLWLHHIALTPDPAYEDAKVLAVRNASDAVQGRLVVATPNLDAVRGWGLEDAYARLGVSVESR